MVQCGGVPDARQGSRLHFADAMRRCGSPECERRRRFVFAAVGGGGLCVLFCSFFFFFFALFTYTTKKQRHMSSVCCLKFVVGFVLVPSV